MDLASFGQAVLVGGVSCTLASADSNGGLALGCLAGNPGAINSYVSVARTLQATPPYTQIFKVVDAADTARTASTEHVLANFNANVAPVWATGAITLNRHVRFQGGPLGFVGASTVTQATTVSIDSAPSAGANATLTDAYGLLTGTGVRSGFGGQLVGNLNALAVGLAAISFPTDANVTITASQAANPILNCTSVGSLTATRNVVLPANPPTGALIWVINGTTGAQSIQIIGQSGTGITIATAKRALVSFDGTNMIRLTADQ